LIPLITDETISSAAPVRPARAARALPELLAPAGDWDCVRAAVENGADAVYFGLEKFNARMRAQNFTEADLPGLMDFLHRRGVKGYVTFNTLVFEHELADAASFGRAIIAAGVDAAIVQDVGICRLLRSLSPDFPLHASTQMTVTSPAGMEFARELGCELVVLARECSIREISLITAPVPGAAHPPLPVEVFVHGALCVAYSGQCLTSEALGGRSANRGECAQACRLPYDLVSDGKLVELGDRKYLLSPQDLAGLPVLPDLVRAGVSSLKIEGRLKAPGYVANITRIYREALDQLADVGPAAGPEQTATYEMEMAFSRGLHTGWFGGVNNQALVHARFGKKRGVFLGAILAKRAEGVVVRLAGPARPGDGVVFDSGHPEETEQGGRIYEIRPLPAPRGGGESPGTLLTFGRDDVDFRRVNLGDRLWKTSDPVLEKRIRQTYTGEKPRFQRPIDLETHGCAGLPLTVIARDGGSVVRVESVMPLTPADHHPLTTERLREQLGRLGGTPFRLGALANHLEGAVLLPVSELNRLRREVATQLEVLRARPQRWQVVEPAAPCAPLAQAAGARAAEVAPELTILVRDTAQMEAALAAGAGLIYLDFEDPKRYREAVRRFRDWPGPRPPGAAVFAAPPRIFKPGEEWVLKQVRSCEADGWLVRNFDQLAFFAGDRCVGDYSLNIANRLAAEYFHGRFKLERITASYDLNFTQLESLLRAAPPEWFEITLHQHIPMFHMEHCVFCAFLSKGTDYTNCGRPCDHHDLRLRDRVGAEHPVKADAGCRNTVFNALAQTGADWLGQMLGLGARRFRLEFLTETPEVVGRAIARYRQLLRGEITSQQLWRELKLVNQLGVTRGQIAGGAGVVSKERGDLSAAQQRRPAESR